MIAFTTPAIQASNFGSIHLQQGSRDWSLAGEQQDPQGRSPQHDDGDGAAIQWAMENALRPTVIGPVLVDDEVYDVQIRDANYNNFLVAWTACPPDATTSGSHPNRVCRDQIIRFNIQHMTDYTSKQRRSTSCHELGHTVGLRHVKISDADTCMRINVIDRPTTYRSHDHSMLESQY